MAAEPGSGSVARSSANPPTETGPSARITAAKLQTTRHGARVVWEGTKADLRAHRVELAGETLRGSCMPELGGNAARADAEQLFVAALSVCHMLWFLALARGERLRVTGYEDDPEGELDGTRFTRVALRPRVSFESDPGSEVLAELHERAHDLCFIANSVNCPVEVESR